MRKEVLFAVLAGAIFGIVIAFGIWRANLALTPETNTSTPPPKAEQDINTTITVAKPENHQVITTPEVTITAITQKNSIVVVSAEEDYLSTPLSDGSFEVEVELTGGINDILITSFNESGIPQTESLLLVLSTALAKQLESGVDIGSESASVRDRVAEKVARAKSVAYATLGTVTDIAESTLQVKTEEGEIVQISVGDDTTLSKIAKTTTSIEVTDVAIGDFIVAMGPPISNGNEAMDALRVLVMTRPSANENAAIYGTIATVERREVALSRDGEETTLKFGKSWKGPETSDLTEGDTLIAVGTLDENSLSVRSIFLLTEDAE